MLANPLPLLLPLRECADCHGRLRAAWWCKTTHWTGGMGACAGFCARWSWGEHGGSPTLFASAAAACLSRRAARARGCERPAGTWTRAVSGE